jgi:hypothetical protein
MDDSGRPLEDGVQPCNSAEHAGAMGLVAYGQVKQFSALHKRHFSSGTVYSAFNPVTFKICVAATNIGNPPRISSHQASHPHNDFSSGYHRHRGWPIAGFVTVLLLPKWTIIRHRAIEHHAAFASDLAEPHHTTISFDTEPQHQGAIPAEAALLNSFELRFATVPSEVDFDLPCALPEDSVPTEASYPARLSPAASVQSQYVLGSI